MKGTTQASGADSTSAGTCWQKKKFPGFWRFPGFWNPDCLTWWGESLKVTVMFCFPFNFWRLSIVSDLQSKTKVVGKVVQLNSSPFNSEKREFSLLLNIPRPGPYSMLRYNRTITRTNINVLINIGPGAGGGRKRRGKKGNLPNTSDDDCSFTCYVLVISDMLAVWLERRHKSF